MRKNRRRLYSELASIQQASSRSGTVPGPPTLNGAARVHHASRRRGGGVAGARTAIKSDASKTRTKYRLINLATAEAPRDHCACTALLARAEEVIEGAKSADLPIEQSTKFEQVIKREGRKGAPPTIPPSLRARADELIE
jgi:hypothetical protein